MRGVPPEHSKFKKGKSGNPSGRPKKTINLILYEFIEKGYEIPNANSIRDVYLFLTIMPQNELKNIIENKDNPMLLRICATNILGNKGFDIIESMLDRAIGKATNKTEFAGEDGSKIDFTINVIQGNKVLPYDQD